MAVIGLALLAAVGALHAQPAAPPSDPIELALQHSRSELVRWTREYKASLQRLIAFYEADMRSAAEQVEKRRKYHADGLVSRRELEESEQALQSAEENVAVTRRRMAEADHLVAEAVAAEQIAKAPALPVGGYAVTPIFLRFNGGTPWSLTDTSKVASFFTSRFGRALPVSAYGQTDVHNRLGFDHRHAIDVAVHPDSAEGEALLSFLRGAGIPFLAFRNAVPGASTGPHVHIGLPSQRLAKR